MRDGAAERARPWRARRRRGSTGGRRWRRRTRRPGPGRSSSHSLVPRSSPTAAASSSSVVNTRMRRSSSGRHGRAWCGCGRMTVPCHGTYRPSRDAGRAGRPRSCCTTTSTAGCGRRRSSSWPPRSATTLPADDAESLGSWFARVGRLAARWSATWRPSTTRSRSCRPRPALRRVARECVRGPGRGRRGLRRGALRPRAAPRARADPRRGRRGRAGRASTRASEAAPRGTPIVVRQLLTAMRHQARVAGDRRAGRSPTATAGVVGFDIAGAEAGYPPTRHLDAFEYLQRENAHFTIHAGEAFGLPSIWQAIQWCGADRLGHGVRIIDDITVDDDGIGRAGPARGVRPGQADPAGDVPVLQRADRRRRRRSPSTRSACSRELRFRVTVNTDNRLMSGTSMTEEMRAAGRGVRLRLDDLQLVHHQRDEVGVPARSTSGWRSSTSVIKPGYAALDQG